ncbi:MAG: hypothetical protein QMD46_05090 [Methanomicrobiales archaeon]|nr:hypothetical protein [Methanomicrobiales archaeon]
MTENPTPSQPHIVLFLGYLFAPLLPVNPLMVARVVAAETFVGKKCSSSHRRLRSSASPSRFPYRRR